MTAPLSVQTTSAETERTGPPIVLVHGFASHGEADWPHERWAQPWAEAGRDVHVVDLPAHGRAPAPGTPVRTAEVVEALASVVRAAGGTADVVAYSLGARLAWDLARVPGVTVRRLVLGGLSAADPFPAVDVTAARAALDGGAWPEDPLTGMILSMAISAGADPAGRLDLVEGLGAEPFDPAGPAPEVPTLLVGGAEDPMAEGVDALAARIPGAVVVRVPGDHVGALASAEFHAAVADFVSR